jgi:hypothetical protein
MRKGGEGLAPPYTLENSSNGMWKRTSVASSLGLHLRAQSLGGEGKEEKRKYACRQKPKKGTTDLEGELVQMRSVG